MSISLADQRLPGPERTGPSPGFRRSRNTPSGFSTWTWFAATTDPRALQKAPPATDRIAACWYSSTSFRIDLAFTDGNTHQISLYLLDYDAPFGGRSKRVDIFDQNGTLLDSRSVSALTNGQYLVWNVSGHVVAQLTNTATSSNNAVISGLFFR
jgi:hypothetical protein